MSLMDESKELYLSEINHSDRLNGKIGNSITFLTIEGTGNIIIWTKYFSHSINTVYLILCFISLVSFIISIFFFYKAYSGYKYAYFPVDDMNNKIIQTNQATKNIKDGIKIAENHIISMFEYTYMKCAIIDFKENLNKSSRHKKFIKYVSISLVIIAITYAYSMIFMDNIHLK